MSAKRFTTKQQMIAAAVLGLGGLLTIAGIMGGIIPSKLGGVCAMFGAILLLFFLPWLDSSPVRSANYRPVYRIFFWVLVVDAIMLGYCGSQPPEGIFPLLSLLGTIYYFGHFLVLMPLLGKFEKTLPLPTSIGVPVTKTAHH